VMMEQDGRIALANRQAERIFGWMRQEMIGKPIEMLVPGGLRDHDGHLRRGLIAPSAPDRAARGRSALDCQRKDGSAFPAEIDLAPVTTENGVLIAIAVEDITSRRVIESALATSRNNLADALESIDRGVILYDKDDRVVICNSRFYEHFPGPADAIQIGARFEDIFRAAVDRGTIIIPDGIDKEVFISERVARHRRPDGQVMTRRLGDGRILHVTEHAARNGGVIGIGADVTEQLKVEEQLRAIQKMEAIGQLTGGMAHDFNNYLGVIVGNLDMLKELKSDDPIASLYVNAALDGALRGAELTQSLLAFSRRKRLDPRFTDLNARVESIAKLLDRMLGEKIRISVAPAPNLWPVEIDAAQLDSCIVNIATNARDAMPEGGALKIATRNELLGDDYVRLNAGVTPGAYATIEISDTGVGMLAATLEHVFEPFFTTKPPGHGTGLGLSMVYGFVKQSGGHIKIWSEPGRGTTVRIYLPRATAAGVVEYAAPVGVAPAMGGTGTVLVVEDNEQLRATAVAQLKSLGYCVLQAQDGQSALDILARRGERVDLLFSDVMMPGGLDGYALAKLAVELHPDLKVLLTSGFPGEALTRMGGEARGFRLIGKPYRKEELDRAVRQVLGS
jgi:PAS domain S-box-containing protein